MSIRPAPLSVNPVVIVRHVLSQRPLIVELTRRELVVKYRGSYLGMAWAVIYPLLLLAAFQIAFAGNLKSDWAAAYGVGAPAALVVYSGIVLFAFFAEVLSAAPRFLLGYQSFIKKVVFPTEILPVVLLLTASFHAVINLVLLTAAAAFFGRLGLSAWFLPLALLPLWLAVLGFAWFLAALGVMVRDVGQVLPILVQLSMFVSPVFFPAAMAPETFRWLVDLNPLGLAIEDLRHVLLLGELPDLPRWFAQMLAATAIAMFGFFYFARSKSDFADLM